MRRAIALLLVVGGCHPQPKETPLDPDRDSGPDGKRSGAQAIAVNRPATDDINFAKGDATDWKMVELRGKPGLLDVRLKWDNPNADVRVDVYNAMGDLIASSPGLQPGSTEKRVTIDAQPGTWFLKIYGTRPEDATVYSIEAQWQSEVTEAITSTTPETKPPDTKPPETTPTDPSTATTTTTPPTPATDDDAGGVEGRIVTAYREGSLLVLHLDKGTAAGVKVGTGGFVLDGPSGAAHLDGGEFTVSQVVDESRSIAKTRLRSIGRNTRVLLLVR